MGLLAKPIQLDGMQNDHTFGNAMNKGRYIDEVEAASRVATDGKVAKPQKKTKKRAQSKDVRRLQSADPQARNGKVPAKSSKKKLQTRVSPTDQMLWTMSGLDRQRMLNVNLSPFNVGYQYGKSKGGYRNGEIDQAMIGEYLLMLQQLRNPTNYLSQARAVATQPAYSTSAAPPRQVRPHRPKSRVRPAEDRQQSSGEVKKTIKKKKKTSKKASTTGGMVQIKPPSSGKKPRKKKAKRGEEKDFKTIEEKDEIEEEDGFKESGRKKAAAYEEDVKIDDDDREDQAGPHVPQQPVSRKARQQDDLIKVDVGEDKQASKARAEARRREEEEADRRKLQDEDDRRQRERADREKREEKERAEREKREEKERQERDRIQREQADRDRRDREEKEKHDREKAAQAEREKRDREEQAEKEKKAAEKLRQENERAEKERHDREKSELEKAERDRKERELTKNVGKSGKDKPHVGDFQIDVPQMDDNLGDDDDDQEDARDDEPEDEGLLEGNEEEELNEEMIQFYNEIPTLTELTEESIHEFKQKMLDHIVKYQIFNSEEFQSLYQATSYKNQEVEEDIITNIFEELATALEEKLGEEGEGMEEGYSDQGDL